MHHAFSMELLLNMSIFSHEVDKPNRKNFVNTPRENRCFNNKKLLTLSHHCYTAKFINIWGNQPAKWIKGSFFLYLTGNYYTTSQICMHHESINFYVKYCPKSMSLRLKLYHSYTWKAKGWVSMGAEGQQAEGR